MRQRVEHDTAPRPTGRSRAVGERVVQRVEVQRRTSSADRRHARSSRSTDGLSLHPDRSAARKRWSAALAHARNCSAVRPRSDRTTWPGRSSSRSMCRVVIRGSAERVVVIVGVVVLAADRRIPRFASTRDDPPRSAVTLLTASAPCTPCSNRAAASAGGPRDCRTPSRPCRYGNGPPFLISASVSRASAAAARARPPRRQPAGPRALRRSSRRRAAPAQQAQQCARQVAWHARAVRAAAPSWPRAPSAPSC